MFTKIEAPRRRDVSTTLRVPPTMTRSYRSFLVIDSTTFVLAAQWTTPSIRRLPMPRWRAERSATSATLKSAWRSTFARSPVERSSTTMTSSPRAISASTTWLPRKPAPPVTRTRNSWPLLYRCVCGRTGGRDGGQRAYAPLRLDASVSEPRRRFRRASDRATEELLLLRTSVLEYHA